MQRVLRRMGVLVRVGTALGCIMWTPAAVKLAAQPAAAPGACTASVTFARSADACPTGSIEFRVSVAGCSRSSGRFDFDYMQVDPTRKASRHGSGTWSRDVKAWTQTEHVALACDQGIYQVEPVGTPVCTCKER